MEINDTQIARLVLGYLKSENCKSAFDEFLTNCKHLSSYAIFVKNGKYFATRVGGLTLEDIISEYSLISLIIQGRLEQTDYYGKKLKMTLPEQLTYILENRSRSASPSLSKELNTTPVESLPGNLSNDTSKTSASDISVGVSSTPNENKSNDSPGLSEKQKKTFAELDDQIRTIKENAEQDPVFDELLGDLIGPRNESTTTKNDSIKIGSSNMVEKTNDNQNCSVPLNVEVGGDSSSKKVVPTLTQQNQIFLTNAGGLLMVPSVVGGSNYILVNNAQPNPVSVNNTMTEADIMKMPTLILDDNISTQKQMVTATTEVCDQVKQPEPNKPIMVTQSTIIVTSKPQVIMSSQKAIVSTTSSQQNKKTLKTLAPKTDKITIASSDGEYYKVLDKDEVKSPEKSKGRPGLRSRSARVCKAKTKASTSPKKEPNPSPKDCDKKKKSAKSLFKDNNKKWGGTWDSDLRELLVPKRNQVEDDSSDERMDVSDNKMDVSINDEELKKEAMLIEAAFKTPVKITQETKKVQAEPTPLSSSEEKSEQSGKSSLKSEEPEEVVLTEETEVYLRNCNGPPRIKKKCNVTNASQVFEIVEVVEIDEDDNVVKVPLDKEETKKDLKSLSLETPVKGICPKTPGKSELTPFSKAIEDQLAGMDLLSMPTPSVIIPTPNFPITPTVMLNTPDMHSNRGTDYSTSSSYYLPSDNEQNKSLEKIMEEYRKEGKKNKESTDNVKTEDKSEVSEMKRMFNKNVIGKKNLNLMKQDSSCSENDCDDSSSESSSSSYSNSEDSDSDFETSAKVNMKSPYTFRKRTSVTPKTDNRTKKATPQSKTKKISPTVQKTVSAKTKKITKVETKITNEVEKCENENEITDDDFALHLSTDEDSTNKLNNETVIMKNKEDVTSPSKEESQTENAKQLIQDLFDGGIHLLPGVRKKTSDSPSETPTVEKNPNALENLEVSSEENSSDQQKDEDRSIFNSSINPEEVTFDNCFATDHKVFNFEYDYNKRRKKQVYDMEVLEKKIEANVYVDALDIDMTRMMTFTLIRDLLECNLKKPPAKRRKSVKPESKPKAKKMEEGEIVELAKIEAITDKEENKSKTQKKSRSQSGKSGAKPESSIEAKGKKDEDVTEDPGYDELMNLAVLGEPEGLGKESNKGREKRKLSSEAAESVVVPEKKTKTETEKHSLLERMDVDLFLNKVHGGSSQSK